MNEKYLWELWGKCKHPHPKYGGGEMVWPMEFAELIVLDCRDMFVVNSPSWNLLNEKLEHFGVEE